MLAYQPASDRPLIGRSGCFPARLGGDLVHQIDLVCTAQLIAAARRLAAPGRISRVPFPWVGHGW